MLWGKCHDVCYTVSNDSTRNFKYVCRYERYLCISIYISFIYTYIYIYGKKRGKMPMWQNTDSYWIQVKDTQVFLILSFQCYYGFKIFFK